MARIWNIRLNLDDFNSALAGLDSDTERLAFLSGFNAGLNGRLKKDVGGPWESGWEVGNTSHVEAIKFSEQQRAKALLRDYHGNATASPRHESGNAMAMPIDNRQSTIEVKTIDNRQSISVATAPKQKSEADLLLKDHPFKISGPKRNHKSAINELLKKSSADQVDEFLGQLQDPLWPDQIVAQGSKWIHGSTQTSNGPYVQSLTPDQMAYGLEIELEAQALERAQGLRA